MDERFEYLEHTADAKFRAYGKTLEEAFENAAFAMFNVMIDTDTVENKVSQEIELSSEDIEALLFNWLSELLFVFEVETMVFGNFIVDRVEEDNGGCRIYAKAIGEDIDLSRHKFDTEVKAATYNDMKVEKTPQGWMIQATVDT
ncbi:archease [Methanolobus zinderi]|jgi:SHS2 domain-containing protein|uniref:Protein archease n=1 Tax=Methanolobus zinderi TaxID=536044 RepID=A0A7D5E7B8_9EURY|nr:archease [Methanolobus zinderi]QLC50672.1 archease [Methanolobus zinderi]